MENEIRKGTEIERTGSRHSLSHIVLENYFHKSTNSHWLQLAEFTIIFYVKTPTWVCTTLWHSCLDLSLTFVKPNNGIPVPRITFQQTFLALVSELRQQCQTMRHRPLTVPHICVSSAWFSWWHANSWVVWEWVAHIIKRRKGPVKDLCTAVRDRQYTRTSFLGQVLLWNKFQPTSLQKTVNCQLLVTVPNYRHRIFQVLVIYSSFLEL